jgi:hypothetical protein
MIPTPYAFGRAILLQGEPKSPNHHVAGYSMSRAAATSAIKGSKGPYLECGSLLSVAVRNYGDVFWQ